MTEQHWREIGRAAFEAYDKDRGGRNHLGQPTPKWTALPEEIRHAWIEASKAAVDAHALSPAKVSYPPVS